MMTFKHTHMSKDSNADLPLYLLSQVKCPKISRQDGKQSTYHGKTYTVNHINCMKAHPTTDDRRRPSTQRY